MAISAPGAPRFGIPDGDIQRRAIEIQNAERIRGLFYYMQKKYGEARLQHQHEYDAARTPPLSPDWRARTMQAKAKLLTLVERVRAEWRYKLAKTALREEDWTATGDMTSKERSDYIQLFGPPQVDDGSDSSSPPSSPPRQKTYRPPTPPRSPRSPPTQRMALSSRAPFLHSSPSPPKSASSSSRQGPSTHVRIEPSEQVNASLIMLVDEDADSDDEDSAVALAEFPDLEPQQRQYLDSVGFFRHLEAKGREMESKFCEVFDERFDALYRGPGGVHALDKDPRVLKEELEQAVARDLHEECQRELQAVFKGHMRDYKVLTVAEEQRLGLRPDDLLYLRRIRFSERVEEIERDVLTEVVERQIEDQVDYVNFATEPGRLPIEKSHKLAEHKRTMEGLEVYGETKVRRMIAEELKRHLENFRGPGLGSPRPSPFAQWGRPGAHKM